MRNRENTVLPPGIKITKCPSRVAQGAHRARIAPRGDAPTLMAAARTTGQINASANRNVIRGLAARGW